MDSEGSRDDPAAVSDCQEEAATASRPRKLNAYNFVMRLAVARICLDCDEVHDREECPVCGSETFAFLTRWVTPTMRSGQESAERPRRAAAGAARTEQIAALRKILQPDEEPEQRPRWPLVARGALGLALVGLARLAWRARPASDDS
jgi:hypothetical protein